MYIIIVEYKYDSVEFHICMPPHANMWMPSHTAWGMEMAIVSINKLNSKKEVINMAKRISEVAVQANGQVVAAGTNPMEELAKSREQFFSIYPEIGNLYNKFGEPETRLSTAWFDKDMAILIGKFVALIKKLEVDELFPNYNNLFNVSSLTDAGTIADNLLQALSTLCKKSFQIKSNNDEIFQMKGYRDMAMWLISRNLDDEIGSENSIITKGLRMFGMDVKTIKDCIDVEREIISLGIDKIN